MKRTKYLSLLMLLFITVTARLTAQEKILIVVTNNKEVKANISGKDTLVAGGYELSEVAEAYKVFAESGFEVDFMSPKGGMTYAEPEEKMKPVNKEFLSNLGNVSKLKNTLAPSQVKAADYSAIYFAGGKTMWDFPDNKAMAKLTAEIYENNGTVGAVCHGPAALINVKLSDGSTLIEGKQISSFTDMEEKLFSKTAKFLPFMLQERLTSLGADFKEAPAMLDQAVVDERLVTGQNPNSTYSVAEEMVKLLGKTPPQRNWDDMSYTLAVAKAIIMENSKKAKRFYKAHLATNQLDAELFQSYSMYAAKGYLGEMAESKGVALLEFATEIFPNSAKSHEALAGVYHKQGKQKQAMASIEKSLSLEPDSESAQKLKKEIKE
ncbi:MAG: hypothetical protein HEP71_04135 [Roseivirga sp.]|nr:hypothetical protein [Roseivirga sp.]